MALSEGEPNSQSEQELQNRITELQGRLRIAGINNDAFMRKILKGEVSIFSEEFLREFDKKEESATTMMVDAFWINAMRKLGFDPELITEIWDKREEVGSEGK